LARDRRLDLQGLSETALRAATKLGVDDAVALAAKSSERMVRFANNSVTVSKTVEETELTVYIAKEGRRAIASTSNPSEGSVRSFVLDLFSSLKGLQRTDYAHLPERGSRFRASGESYDRKIAGAGGELADFARMAIDSSLKAGAKRSAGIVSADVVEYSILASNGTSGVDRRASIELNIRSFADGDASGHGLSCSATLSGFRPAEAGERAGEDARRMVNAIQPEPGEYRVLMSPTVASNLIGSVSNSASAFAVEAGLSYLAERVGRKVASESVTVIDHGTVSGCLGGRSFDDEGMKTGTTRIIEKGELKTYLHNLTTAKRWKTSTTGNAGIVSPHPWNIEVMPGDSSFDEMVKEMKHGIVLTSNWYTRFKNYRTGEFSTVPRDGAFLVEGGNLARPLKGMRVSDDLLRLFSSVGLLSRERSWIHWWEVDTPTLCPWLLADGVRITRAYD
jgi:PmbA protein